MDFEKLKQFNNDAAMSESVHAFMVNELNKESLRRVYNGEDVSSMKEAKDILNQSFRKIEEQFKPKPEKRNPAKGV